MTIGRMGYLSAGLRTQECIARQTRIFWDANSSPNDTSRHQQNKKQEKFSWRPALQSRLWMKATRSHSLPSLHYLPLLNPIAYHNIPLTDALAPQFSNILVWQCALHAGRQAAGAGRALSVLLLARDQQSGHRGPGGHSYEETDRLE
jgi:hypothetical protein